MPIYQTKKDHKNDLNNKDGKSQIWATSYIYLEIHRITLWDKKSVRDRQPRTAFEMFRCMGTYMFSLFSVDDVSNGK